MLLPTSDPMAHPAQEQAGDAAGHPSSAIYTGAERIMQLMEDEKSKLSAIYLHALKTLEDDFRATKVRSERAIAAAEGRLKEQSSKMYELEVEVERAVQSAEGSRRELVMTRAENEHLKAALVAAGFDYVDGRIVFSQKTAQIVDDFVAGARKQSEAMLTVTSPTLRSATLESMLSNNVGPEQFFEVLASVLHKGREFADTIKNKQFGSPTSSSGQAGQRLQGECSTYPDYSSPYKLRSNKSPQITNGQLLLLLLRTRSHRLNCNEPPDQIP